MNLSLKPHPLIAHWFPGFIVVALVVLSHFDWDYSAFINTLAGTGPGATVSVLLLSVAAFFIGEVLDSVRDLLESVWDWMNRIEWKYFAAAEMEKADQLSDYYFTYYVLDSNLVLALGVLLLSYFLNLVATPHDLPCHYRFLLLVVIILCMCIFTMDAIKLRREIADITKEGYKKLEDKPSTKV